MKSRYTKQNETKRGKLRPLILSQHVVRYSLPALICGHVCMDIQKVPFFTKTCFVICF